MLNFKDHQKALVVKQRESLSLILDLLFDPEEDEKIKKLLLEFRRST
jgi:hypothetical protein